MTEGKRRFIVQLRERSQEQRHEHTFGLSVQPLHYQWQRHTSMKFSDGLCCPIGADTMLELLVAVVVVVSELLCYVDDRDLLSLISIDPYLAVALVKGVVNTMYVDHDAAIKTLVPGGKQRTSSIDPHSRTSARGETELRD